MRQNNTVELPGGIRSVTEEIAGKKRFCILKEEGWPPAYQMGALEDNDFGGLLQMSFTEIAGQKMIYYDCDGFIQLTNALSTDSICGQRKESTATESLLRILSEAAVCVLKIEDRLLLAGGFLYTAETIFLHADTGEVRMAYIPVTGYECDSLRMLLDLIKRMQDLCRDDEWQSYADDLLREIPAENKGFSELIKYFNRKARDSCTRGWPGQSMEREATDENTEVSQPVPHKKRSVFSF
jgi:hypothetical protein